MIVESKVQDFYKKLEENVTSDKLIWFFSPKRYNGKEFSGVFDKKDFKIHFNSVYKAYRLIDAIGSYKRKGNCYEVDYEIKENGLKFKYILMIMVLLIIIVNTVQFFENADLNLIAGIDFIFLIFFSFISLVHFLITRTVKKDLKKKFEEIFEITANY